MTQLPGDVLQVSRFYYPKVGGVEQVVRTLSEGIHGDDWRVRVLAATTGGLGTFETINRVRVTRASCLGTVLAVPLAPTYPYHLGRQSRRADIVHHHLPNPLGVGSQLVVGDADAALVATYHSDIVRQSSWLSVYEPLLHRFLERTDRIIATSPRLIEHSEHLQPYEDKCGVVPPSIDVDRYGQYDGPKYDLPGEGDRPTLLFVGRLNYYKGVEYLLDAMQQVDARLLVVGDGNRRESLERRARDREVEDKVHFLGQVPDEKLHYCYDVADVFVLPSVERSEAFGIVQLEAMAYRTPVVNTDLPSGVPWVSQDGETGFTVPPRDTDALAEAITTLLSDEKLRSEYGENGRARVKELFGHEVNRERVLAIYDEYGE